MNDLIDWGMMDNYDQESEHSATAEVPSTEADTLPPLKREKQFCYWIPILRQVRQRQKLLWKATLPTQCPQQQLIAAVVAVL